jgi:MFS family permease
MMTANHESRHWRDQGEKSRGSIRMAAEGGSAGPRAISPFSAIAITVVIVLGLLYIVSQFLRNSVSVIAPNLADEMALSPMQIGLLSSMYFFFFAATQLPLGLALDRWGPKRCMLAAVGVTILGCIVFAMSHGAPGLVGARALLGLGTAPFLVAPVALYARWFPERFSTFAGVHLGLGSLGALLATAPLAFATNSFGWRATFLAVSVCAVGIGVLVWLIVTDEPPGATVPPHKKESFRDSVAGIWEVIRTPSIGRVFMVQLSSYPSYVVLVGLWGGPYLTHVYGYDLKGRGGILFISALSQVLASFLWGPSVRLFGRHKLPIIIATTICFISLLMLAGIGTLPIPLLMAVFIMLGFSTGMTSVVLSHGKSLVPPHLLGRTITLLNIGTMGGSFVVQFVSGTIINLFPAAADGVYPLEAYRVVFGVQAVIVAIALFAYFGSRESHLGHP